MAATTMMIAALGSCSNEDLATNENPEQKKNIVTLTTTLLPKGGGATTRSLTDPGDGTLSSTWAVGEKIWVKYTNTSHEDVSAMASVISVDGSGAATISVTLVDPCYDSGYNILSFGYPYSFYATPQKNIYTDQIGTLADISANFDACNGTGLLTEVGGEPSLPTGVDMDRQTCVWKLSFTTPATSDIKQLAISDGSGGDPYVVTVPDGAKDAIYVATYGTPGEVITFTATTASGCYTKATPSGVTLEAGKLYTTTGLTMNQAKYRIYSTDGSYSEENIPGGATIMKGGMNSWAAGTYVVCGTPFIIGFGNIDINLTGNANLILLDGAELYTDGCIFGGSDYNHGYQYSLNIYGQSTSTGKLTIEYDGSHSLGVFTASALNIHGGEITVGGSGVYQGFEPRELNVYHGTVSGTGKVDGIMAMSGGMNVYGGTVIAHSTDYGSALFLPEGGSNLTISGGTVTATSDVNGQKGIEVTNNITITGGVVTATGGSGAVGLSCGGTLSLTYVTMYEGDTADPATPAASQSACTKRYVKIQ